MKVNFPCDNCPSSSVTRLIVLVLCFTSYFIAVQKNLPVWPLVQSAEVRWSVCLRSETDVAWTNEGKILKNICSSSPPHKIAATFKKYTPYTLICLISHSECTFRVFPVMCSPNCPLIIGKSNHSDWQIAICASFVSYKKAYSYGANDKIQVINHVLWNRYVAWFNIQST